MTAVAQRSRWNWALALFAIAFGLLTIKEGGSVLVGDVVARAAAGTYVPFVLWFNFIAGFAYVIAGAGLWRLQRWAVGLTVTIAAATVVVFAAFGLHVASGDGREGRTLVAMTLRSVVWITIAAIATHRIRQRRSSAACAPSPDPEADQAR